MDAATTIQCTGPVNSHAFGRGVAIHTRQAGAAWAAWAAFPGTPAAGRYLFLEATEAAAVASAKAKQR